MTHCSCCGLTASSTLRGPCSSVRRTRKQWALPVGPCAVPHRTYPTSMYWPELCARPGFQPEGLPPVPPPPKPRGPGTFAVQPGFPDTPCLFTGLSAGPVGHRQPGSPFPRSPAAGEGNVYVDDVDVDTTPYPAFGTRSQSTSSLTCPGRPTVNPQNPLWVCADRDRATASQRLRSPLSAAPAGISPGTRLPRQRNVCGGHTPRPPAPGTTRDVGPRRV